MQKFEVTFKKKFWDDAVNEYIERQERNPNQCKTVCLCPLHQMFKPLVEKVCGHSKFTMDYGEGKESGGFGDLFTFQAKGDLEPIATYSKTNVIARKFDSMMGANKVTVKNSPCPNEFIGMKFVAEFPSEIEGVKNVS